jgi:hypothetical protein
MGDVEAIGPFVLHPPSGPLGGWGVSWDGVWLPVILADRDACLVIAGMVLAGADDGVLEALRDRYNWARPSVLVTVSHILGEGA